VGNSNISLEKEKREEILHRLKSFLQKKPEVLYVYVFGSFIKDQPFEDLDVALYLRNRRGREVLKLERELEEFLRLPVEVSLLNEASLSFAFRIVKEGRLIFARDNRARCDFEEKIRVLYFDFLPFYQRYYKEVVLGQG
jgi:predicted nucleotidyltransferase